MGLGDLAQTPAARSIVEDAGFIEHEWLTTDLATFKARASHASADALDDQRSFQLW